jgi:hypothetical protein
MSVLNVEGPRDHPDYAGRCEGCGAAALLANTHWWDCTNPSCPDTTSRGLMGDRNDGSRRSTQAMNAADCRCRICANDEQPASAPSTFIVCDACGNKRCPHATFHGHKCTYSNAPGQEGSVYGNVRCANAECACAPFADVQDAHRNEHSRLLATGLTAVDAMIEMLSFDAPATRPANERNHRA